MSKKHAGAKAYSELLWARIDRNGVYLTELYPTLAEAAYDRPSHTDAKWAVVRVKVTEVSSKRKGGA